jgi:hypothetical protein
LLPVVGLWTEPPNLSVTAITAFSQGKVRCNPSRLILAEQLDCRAATGLVLIGSMP